MLRHQPYSWNMRFGDKESGAPVHADFFGHSFAFVCVFNGCKRFIIFRKRVPEKDRRLCFGLQLTEEDKEYIKKYDGVEFILTPGKMLIFQACYFHAVTNLADRTLSSHGIFLTYNNLFMVATDALEAIRCKVSNGLSDWSSNCIWWGSCIDAMNTELHTGLQNQCFTNKRQLVQLLTALEVNMKLSQGHKTDLKTYVRRLSLLRIDEYLNKVHTHNAEQNINYTT